MGSSATKKLRDLPYELGLHGDLDSVNLAVNVVRIVGYSDLLDHLSALERYAGTTYFEVFDDLDRVACCKHVAE